MKLATTLITGISAAFLISAGANTIQYYINTKQEMLLEIEVKRNQINTDQINEFIMTYGKSGSAFMDPSQDSKYADNQGFIRGILSVVTKASPHEKGYQSGFNIGQKETMKALSTIMKSGDNIQNAIKDFVDQQSKRIEEKTESKASEKPSK